MSWFNARPRTLGSWLTGTLFSQTATVLNNRPGSLRDGPSPLAAPSAIEEIPIYPAPVFRGGFFHFPSVLFTVDTRLNTRKLIDESRGRASTLLASMSFIMLDGPAFTQALETCGITHVVWIPDSHLGTWEAALLKSATIKLIRATREGEAIAIGGGLLLGGAKPIVAIQCTGLFEAGDALRNIVHDLGLPLVIVVGVRSYLAHLAGKTTDNCPTFTEPILDAWKLEHAMIDPTPHGAAELIGVIRQYHRSGKAGAILIAE